MARVLKLSQIYLHTPRASAPSQSKLLLIYRPRRHERLSWPWVVGWLHAEIDVWHRELSSVAHLSTNRARSRLTSLIEANALTTTPDHYSCI